MGTIEIISHAVWLYFRFALSYRNVEELLAERGAMLTYETIRQWCRTFGQTYANELRRRRPRPGDQWHLDEIFITISGATHSLWRAVDQDGTVLDILVQSHRNKQADERFFRKLFKGLEYVPRVVIIDKLGSYGAARRAVLPSVEHRQHQRSNNRAEDSHQPGSASGGGGGSNPHATPSGSSLPTGQLLRTSARAAIASLLPPTARPVTSASPPGAK